MKGKIENSLEGLSEGSFFNFPKLSEILVEKNAEDSLKNTVEEDVKEHLKILLNKPEGYFSDVSVKPWISDPFSSTIKKTYLCEKGFSTLVFMKTKQRSRLEPSTDMRVSLSTTRPRIDLFVHKNPEHLSTSRDA